MTYAEIHAAMNRKCHTPKLGPGWAASGRGVTRRYDHESGWTVKHCGHPTALYPWAVYDPEGYLHTCGDACHLGTAFPWAIEAIAHAEKHLAGTCTGRGRR